MSLLRRMRDITAASFNEMLDESRDPLRLIDQYLMERKEQIVRLEVLFRQCAAHTQSMKRQYLTAKSLKEKREQQAILALKADEEGIARLALQDKMAQEEKSEQYGTLYEQSRQSAAELKEQLRVLKTEYEETLGKRTYYMARLEAAQLRQRMAKQASAHKAGTHFAMFDRLEEQLSDMEISAQSLKDIRQMGQTSFRKLGEWGYKVQTSLDVELQSMKERLEKEGWGRS